MAKKKVDLKKEAIDAAEGAEQKVKITDAMLRELCPKHLLTTFKAAKTPAQKADFLFQLDREDLKEARDAYNKLDAFAKKIKAWFVQEFNDDQQGVTGKFGRVEIKQKEYADVQDWDLFYGHIKKKGEFDLLNKAVNNKAVADRWEQGKQIPGVKRGERGSVSLTSVKGK